MMDVRYEGLICVTANLTMTATDTHVATNMSRSWMIVMLILMLLTRGDGCSGT